MVNSRCICKSVPLLNERWYHVHGTSSKIPQTSVTSAIASRKLLTLMRGLLWNEYKMSSWGSCIWTHAPARCCLGGYRTFMRWNSDGELSQWELALTLRFCSLNLLHVFSFFLTIEWNNGTEWKFCHVVGSEDRKYMYVNAGGRPSGFQTEQGGFRYGRKIWSELLSMRRS